MRIPDLLPTQENAILQVLERHGFSRHDFDRRPMSAAWAGYGGDVENPSIWFRMSSGNESPFRFGIGELPRIAVRRGAGRVRGGGGEYCVRYSPGEEGRQAEEFQLKWAEVLDHADIWAQRLREEVAAVDRWEGAFEGDPFTQIIGVESDPEAELTPKQKDVIQERLGHVEARMAGFGDLVAGVERRLMAELAPVKVDVATLERKQAERSVLGWFWRALMLGLSWENVTALWKTFVEGADLLPPGDS